MQKVYFFFLLVGIVFQVQVRAQDSLFSKKDVVTPCKILQISPIDIRYKRFDNLNGPDYVVKRADYSFVIFENRTVEYLETETELETSAIQDASPPIEYVKNTKTAPTENTYYKGYLDAERFYKVRQSTGTVVTLSTLILTPLYGLIPVTIIALSKPNITSYVMLKPDEFKSPEYRLGFEQQAASMKRKRVWRNYGIVSGVYVAVYLIVLFSFIQ